MVAHLVWCRAMMTETLLLLHLFMALLLIALSSTVVSATPLVVEVYGGSTKCLRYIVPPEDDAHMVFMALSANEDDEVEDYYVNMVGTMTKDQLKERDKIPPVPTAPDDIRNKLKVKEGDNTKTFLRIQKPERPVLRHQILKYNSPIVMRNVVQMAAASGQGADVPLGGFEVCFKNGADWKDDIDVHIVFDMILVSGDDDDDAEIQLHKRKIVRKEQLTPLEMNLEDCVDAAEDILDEFKYMERRERRMRQTADSTNRRVRYFSYLSVCILLSVTWLQVTYLKSYFKKKKLM